MTRRAAQDGPLRLSPLCPTSSSCTRPIHDPTSCSPLGPQRCSCPLMTRINLLASKFAMARARLSRPGGSTPISNNGTNGSIPPEAVSRYFFSADHRVPTSHKCEPPALAGLCALLFSLYALAFLSRSRRAPITVGERYQRGSAVVERSMWQASGMRTHPCPPALRAQRPLARPPYHPSLLPPALLQTRPAQHRRQP